MVVNRSFTAVNRRNKNIFIKSDRYISHFRLFLAMFEWNFVSIYLGILASVSLNSYRKWHLILVDTENFYKKSGVEFSADAIFVAILVEFWCWFRDGGDFIRPTWLVRIHLMLKEKIYLTSNDLDWPDAWIRL